MLNRIAAFITAFVIFLGSMPTSLLPEIPEPVSQNELADMSTFLKEVKSSDTIYVVDAVSLPTDEKNTLLCIEGIIAKTEPCLFIIVRNNDRTYLNDLKKAGKTLVEKDLSGNKWTTKSIIEKFKDKIGDSGYCVYTETSLAYGLNTAVNYATLFNWLPVSERLVPMAQSCGLTEKMNLCDNSDDLSLQKEFFKKYKDKFSDDAVVHVNNYMTALRDLAIQQGYFCFFTEDNRKGLNFLNEVLSYTGYNTAVLGWVLEEKRCVAEISKCGCWLNPTDKCANNTILAFIDNENITQSVKEGIAATDESKHYICLLYSDGDNCQWIQNGYGEYFGIRKYSSDIAMSWSFSPFLKDFCPSMYNRVVSATDENNQLIGGPSGLGYCTLSRYPAAALDEYSTMTAAAMKRSGQNIMVSLDDYTSYKDTRMQYALSYFSRFDNIDGGLLFLDPDGYRGGRGKVWFCDDKPFISVRLSLWCDEGYAGVTNEWVKEQADIINSYVADIHSVNGYSLICVQAWTMETEWNQVFIDNLDEDVVVLNASDFIATIKKNVPHENALPDTSNQLPILK